MRKRRERGARNNVLDDDARKGTEGGHARGCFCGYDATHRMAPQDEGSAGRESRDDSGNHTQGIAHECVYCGLITVARIAVPSTIVGKNVRGPSVRKERCERGEGGAARVGTVEKKDCDASARLRGGEAHT